jgi:putative ABC transport system permease protein
MVRLAWRMLRTRPATIIATFVALWLAVVIVTACGAMLESGVRFHGPLQRYAAAPVLVATTDITTTQGSGDNQDSEATPLAERGHVDPSLIARIETAPGVRAAISDISVPAQVITASGTSSAEMHPWSAAPLTPFALPVGSAPARDDQAVVDARLAARLGVRVGQSIRLDVSSGLRSFTVSGLAAPTGVSPDQPTVFVTDGVDRSLAAQPNSAGVIGVLADPGVDVHALAANVRAALPPAPDRPNGAYPRVFVGSDRGSVESPAVGNAREFVIAVSSVFGGMTLLIAILVIAGTVGLSVRQRQRDIALLRAIAATPRQVRRMVVRESTALGIVAAAAGIVPGLAAARWLRDQFVTHGMVPDSLHTVTSWLPPLVAGSSAVLVAALAAWIASLRASRVRPNEALMETSVERNGIGVIRPVLGVVALAGGITLSIVSASIDGDSAAGVSVATVFTLVVAVALLGPLLLRTVAATIGRLMSLTGVTGRLAGANVAASSRELSVVLSSVVLAVALGGSLWFVQASQQHVAAEQTRSGVLADYVITPPPAGLSASAMDSIRHTDGVVAATGVVHSTMFSGGGNASDYAVQGIDLDDLSRTMDLDVTSGSLADLQGQTVAVDSLTAQSLHLRVGQEFSGWYGDGEPTRLRVVAIYRRGLGFASLTLPRDVLAPHTDSDRDDAVFVATAPGGAGVAHTLRVELGRTAPGSSVVTRSAYQVGLSADLAQNAWTNKMITAVLVIYVVIAGVNSLVIFSLGRRRQFAILRLSGTTPTQVLRMVRWELVLLLGFALVIGAGIAAATLIPMVKGTTGTPSPYIPPTGWVAVIGGTVILAGLATVVPVRRVLRMRPVAAIGIRE